MADQFSGALCSDCGKKIKDDERYCPHCGADLEMRFAPTAAGYGGPDSDLARYYYEMAEKSYGEDTILDGALANCESAIEADPRFAEAHYLRGLILEEMEQLEEAIKAYRESLRLDPANEEVLITLKDAEEYWANEVKENAIPESRLEKAQRLYDENTDLDKALSNCEAAIKQDPTSAAAHDLRGLILDAIGRTDEAILSYREALRLDPNFKDAQANLRDAEGERIVGREPVFNQPAIEIVGNADEQGNGIGKYIFWAVAALVVGCALLIGFGFTYKFAGGYLTPKTPITLVPDVPAGTVVDKADLERAAQILTDRSKRLGYSNVSFEVSASGEIVGAIPVTLDANEFIYQVGAIGLLEFVDFGKSTPPIAGSIIRTDLENKYLPQTEGQEWHTIMSNNGIQTASASQNQLELYQIDFSLTGEGSQIFLDHTTQNIGGYLGIVLDKLVISAPIIHAQITSGQGSITGSFTEGEAQSLAVVLQTKPLPFAIRIK